MIIDNTSLQTSAQAGSLHHNRAFAWRGALCPATCDCFRTPPRAKRTIANPQESQRPRRPSAGVA